MRTLTPSQYARELIADAVEQDANGDEQLVKEAYEQCETDEESEAVVAELRRIVAWLRQ